MVSVTGFVLAGNNQVGPVLAVKENWSEDESSKYNTIISTCAIGGLVAGSLFSGVFLPMGRRRCAIFALFIGALALLPTLYWLNLYIICGFRCLFGFTCGVIISCGNLMSGETTPKEN